MNPVQKIRSSTVIKSGLRLLLGGTFVAAAVLKILTPDQFIADVDNYRLLPRPLVFAVANTLPWVELIAGACLIGSLYVRKAAVVISFLSAVFFVATLSALMRGLDIACGCFGTTGGLHNAFVSLGTEAVLFCMAALLAASSRPTD